MNQKVTSFRLLIGETTAGLVQQLVHTGILEGKCIS